MKDVLKETLTRLESIHGREGGVTGVPSGFSKLDQMTAGWQNSDLVILAADPRSVSPEEISEIEIVETFSRGHSVYAVDEVANSESGRVQ